MGIDLYRSLNDGNRMPSIGFGTWPLDDWQAEQAVKLALSDGYRLIDTAARYGNETGVGMAIAQADVAREEIFLTTKLRGFDHGYDKTLRAFEESAKLLGVDYIDLYLIHWPLPAKGLYVDSWKAMIRLRSEGKCHSIGVSNFAIEHIQRLIDETGEVPSVNQVELHPDFSQARLREFHRTHDIVTEAWSPLGRGTLIKNEIIGRIATKHRRTPAQIMLRWIVQLDVVPIPRSSNPQRIAGNRQIFDFELDRDDMAELSMLDGDHRMGGDPDIYIEE